MTPNPNDPAAVLAWVSSQEAHHSSPERFLTILRAWAPVVLAAQRFVPAHLTLLNRDAGFEDMTPAAFNGIAEAAELAWDDLYGAVRALEGEPNGRYPTDGDAAV